MTSTHLALTFGELSTICPGILPPTRYMTVTQHRYDTACTGEQQARRQTKHRRPRLQWSQLCSSAASVLQRKAETRRRRLDSGHKTVKRAWSSQLFGILVIEHKNTAPRAQTRGVSLLRSLGSLDSVVRKTLQGRRREDLFFFVSWSNIRLRQTVLSGISCWWASPAVVGPCCRLYHASPCVVSMATRKISPPLDQTNPLLSGAESQVYRKEMWYFKAAAIDE